MSHRSSHFHPDEDDHYDPPYGPHPSEPRRPQDADERHSRPVRDKRNIERERKSQFREQDDFGDASGKDSIYASSVDHIPTVALSDGRRGRSHWSDADPSGPLQSRPARGRWDDEDEPLRSHRATGFGGRVRSFTDRFVAMRRPAAKSSANAKSKTGTPKTRMARLLDQFKGNRSAPIVLVLLILFGCIAPTLFDGVVGYRQYSQIKTIAYSGVGHLTNAKNIMSAAAKTADPTKGFGAKANAALQPAVLVQVQAESVAAQSDFQQLDQIIEQRQGILLFAGATPFNGQLISLTHLARIGVDASVALQQVAAAGPKLVPIFSSSITASTGGPIFTDTTFTAFADLLTSLQGIVDDIGQQFAQVQLSGLPLSATNKAQIKSFTSSLPQIVQFVDFVVPNLPTLKWIIGVDSPRNFLLQTMDRGELRPGGGFTGQFGHLALDGGRLGSINLSDVTILDNNYIKHHAPPSYQSWWPFGSFGLRESNLSGDFPTSAQLAMSYYHIESGLQTDGDINLSVLAIAHLLATDIVGPVTLPCYNVTVTAENLENEIHYYQLGNGVATDYKCSNGATGTTTVRKSFTAALAAVVQDKIRSLPADRLIKLVQGVASDFKAKNIEVYFADPQAEAMLAAKGFAATMLRDTTTDATFIVQANISANKGSIFVTTKAHETITLDAAGNAKHALSVSMYYHPTGDVYSPLNTMRDYIRIYVPANAQYLGGAGFDETTSPPLCYGICTPKQAPVCDKTSQNPTGQFAPGPFFPTTFRTEGSGYDPVVGVTYTDDIGAPTNHSSDEPQRAMMGGLIVIPAFCTATWSLQWMVPNIAGSSVQQNTPYTFTEQHQSGSDIDLTLAITPAAGVGSPSIQAHTTDQQEDLTWKLKAHA